MSFCANRNKTDKSGMTNKPASDDESVPPAERRRKVLRFIEEHDMPLPPLAIYAGLKRQEGITFSYRTVQNALADLVEEGSLIRVDTKALKDEDEIVPIEDGGGRRSYYFITTEGRERLE